jgi:arylsulfatase A
MLRHLRSPHPRHHLRAAWLVAAVLVAGTASHAYPGPGAVRPPAAARPNIVVVLADDMGYGDLSGYGHPSNNTPRLDRMAAEGIRLTTVYAAPACTPSRAGLMTGRYPRRSGLNAVLMPASTNGMPASEVTLAELLKAAGYHTAMVGKWHLGHLPGFFPTEHGFDEYFGLIYSNDMIRPWVDTDAQRRLFRGTRELPGDVDMNTLTRRYADEAIHIIDTPRNQPLFLYLAYTMPHVPIGASPAFAGRSAGGRYGDTIEELDAETGRVLDALRARGLDRNTLVIFTSDNGPWAEMPARMLGTDTVRQTDAGSAGPFRGSKGSTWEGGVRVPMIARWPGRIPAGSHSTELAATMDVYATVAAAAGVAIPADRPMDTRNLWPLMTGRGPSARSDYIYFNDGRLEGVRDARWKLRAAAGADGTAVYQLFDMVNDPYERFDVAASHADIVAAMRTRLRVIEHEIPKQ